MKNKIGLIVLLVFMFFMTVVPTIWYDKKDRELIDYIEERNKEMEQCVIFCEDKNDSLQYQKFLEAVEEIYGYDREELQ